MSVGTIVTIVLLVTVLVLGLVLVRTIFASAKGAVDLTDQQLRNELSKLFGEERRVSIFPGPRENLPEEAIIKLSASPTLKPVPHLETSLA